jgi:hypothetical protein
MAGLAPEATALPVPQEALTPEEQLMSLLAGPSGGEIPQEAGQAGII